jgi:hypothetical protein
MQISHPVGQSCSIFALARRSYVWCSLIFKELFTLCNDLQTPFIISNIRSCKYRLSVALLTTGSTSDFRKMIPRYTARQKWLLQKDKEFLRFRRWDHFALHPRPIQWWLLETWNVMINEWNEHHLLPYYIWPPDQSKFVKWRVFITLRSDIVYGIIKSFHCH